MLRLWKRLRQRICNILIRMYFANLNPSLVDVIAYHVETPEYMLGRRMTPQLLRIGNGTLAITEDSHRVTRAREYAELLDKLPELDSSISHFRGSHILRLHCRLSHY